MFGCGLKEDTLEKYASEIGSDCSFFIGNRPGLVSGRGNILEPVDLNLAGYYLVLVLPDVSVPTELAYRLVNPSENGPSLRDVSQLKPAQWKEVAVNHFETAVFKKFPELGVIKEELYRSGADYAAMTGSGSAVYGIFRSGPRLSGGLKDYRTFIEKLV
jgi:4-diphosphocytidyl-2-C-methyl-D-erythritol kinase